MDIIKYALAQKANLSKGESLLYALDILSFISVGEDKKFGVLKVNDSKLLLSNNSYLKLQLQE